VMQADPTIKSGDSAIAKIAISRYPEDQALWRAYKITPQAPQLASEPMPIECSPAYAKLMRKAQKLRKREPRLSEAQAFAKVAATEKGKALMAQDREAHMAKGYGL
jgi:hypothetical protein